MISVGRSAANRHCCHGVLQIVRFNWPYYVVASAAVMVVQAMASRLPVNPLMCLLLYCAVAPLWWWIAASLAVSWIVYDRSPLMKGSWMIEMLGFSPASWISIHAGFDEMTPLLRARFAGSRGTSIDIFDPIRMQGASIARARRYANLGSESVGCRRIPTPAASADGVFLLLSAHELRSDAARDDLFREVCRILAPAGHVVVVEHLRNLQNLAAYGPGFLHFHSRRTWTRGFARAGFEVQDERAITPFVRVFILRRAL